MRAVSTAESGAWLQAIPIHALRLHLDDEVLRIVTCYRLGLPIFGQPVQCSLCRKQCDIYGLHPLSCQYGSARIIRHSDINGIIHQTLNSLGYCAVREPEGLCRVDGKKPDGITRIPYVNGLELIWDATVVDTLCISYVANSSVKEGSAAHLAEEKKRNKYASVLNSHPGRFFFVPSAVESCGTWGKEAHSMMSKLGKELAVKTGDFRSFSYVSQRLSLAIQRGNARIILSSFPYSESLRQVDDLV